MRKSMELRREARRTTPLTAIAAIAERKYVKTGPRVVNSLPVTTKKAPDANVPNTTFRNILTAVADPD